MTTSTDLDLLLKSYEGKVLATSNILFRLLEKEHFAAATEIVPDIKAVLDDFKLQLWSTAYQSSSAPVPSSEPSALPDTVQAALDATQLV